MVSCRHDSVRDTGGNMEQVRKYWGQFEGWLFWIILIVLFSTSYQLAVVDQLTPMLFCIGTALTLVSLSIRRRTLGGMSGGDKMMLVAQNAEIVQAVEDLRLEVKNCANLVINAHESGSEHGTRP